MGDAMDQALCLEAKNGFAQWRPADAQPSRKVDFVDGLPGRDASLHDRLHDLIEDAIGERYARDGLDGGGLSTVYSHGGMKASAPREGKKISTPPSPGSALTLFSLARRTRESGPVTRVEQGTGSCTARARAEPVVRIARGAETYRAALRPACQAAPADRGHRCNAGMARPSSSSGRRSWSAQFRAANGRLVPSLSLVRRATAFRSARSPRAGTKAPPRGSPSALNRSRRGHDHHATYGTTTPGRSRAADRVR